MEEYLRRVQSRVGAGPSEGPVHALLGGPEPDVNTVAATLCLALHLSQSSEGVCVPVLCRKRGGTVLPDETVRYLQRVKVSESLLLWKEDVDLVSLHHSGKLLLTLLRDGLLDSSERSTLESSIRHVVHRHEPRGAEADGALSALTTVAREILQEAAEQSRAALGEALGEALRLQREVLWIERGCRSDELEELVRTVERWAEGRQQDLMQLLATEPREFSDGEMTIALTSLTTDKEDWQNYVEGLKSFCHQHSYDGLVVLLSISDSVHHPRQQVAVYSNNTDLLNQICAELEESSSWALSGELEDMGSLQVFHIPINTSEFSGALPLLEEEIQDLLKNFIDRRSSLLACHPSSRTSSTEGVAGSVEFSQGSSGINDMDGSDIERVEGGIGSVVAVARVMGEREEDTGGVNAGGEILSPDSGMTTIRSSRSSKESSVFLSDDSPLGEITASGGPAAGPGGLRNPSPLSFLSLSPPVPPERRKHRSNRNRNDNINLFNFDPLQSSDQPLPAGGELVNSQGGGDEGDRRAGSSSLSELDELSLIDFSAPNSLGGLESGRSSVDHQGTIHGNELMETMVPPTPVNSLVGSRPPSSCGIRFFPEDVIERINVLQHKDSMSSSLSETWDELCFDTHGAVSSADNTLNRSKSSGSPQIIEGEITGNYSDFTERDGRDQISKPEADHQRVKRLEPQLSLVTDQTETCKNWNPGFVLQDQWKPVTLADLQLTPPEDGVTVKSKAEEDRMPSLKNQKTILNTLTPDPSKEEDDGVQSKKEDQHLELLDFWTYSAQQGLLKLDSGTTASYPESLDMWNMTIRDDSLSPLTTPDNLSETSGSFYGLNPNIKKETSVESPLGYSEGGMQMWNTTIQEDSSSPLTTPEGPENQKDLGHEGSLDDSLQTHPSKQTEEDKASEDDSGSKGENDAPEEVECRGNEHKVKIVIETVDGETRGKETSSKDIQFSQSKYSEVFSDSPSKHSEDETSLHQSTAMWELPIHGMVTSTSEYDNLGHGEWSQISSPDNCASPVADMIQLEEQSSPFIAVSKPIQRDERQSLSQTADIPKRTTISDINQTANQVFLFDKEFGLLSKSGESPVDIKTKNTDIDESEEADWMEQSSEHSPFVLVDTSTFAQDSESCGGAAEIQTNHSISLSCDNWDSHVSEKHSDSEAALSLHLHLPIKIPHSEDVSAFETQEGNGKENKKDIEGKISDNLSLNYIPGGRTSNSDESLFSGLEMENIVPGTVKEANREWSVRLTQDDKQAKGTRKSMETFSILSYAATVLKTHAQTAHQDHMENTHQDSQHQLVPEMISPSQSKTNSEAFSPSDCRPTEEEENKTESSTVARSVSPSLRYPSDHFLKTREEVYVRSQISMEDSDEGGESPSAPPPSATSLGDFQVWGGQLVRQETESPVLTNSSVSPSSSLVGSPANEPSISTDKRLGLPFSGDLMEEEQDEDLDSDHSTLPKWTREEHGEREERHELGSSDLLSFSEDLIAGSSFQQTDLQTIESEEDKFLLNREDYCSPQRLRTDKWSIDRQSGDYKVSEDVYSPVLRRHQDVTPQLSSQPTCENAAFQSAGSPNTTQGQTKYGYNFHHIDQRTENQSTSRACAETKSESRQQNATEVYAEFTTDALAKRFGSKQSENQFETGVDQSLDDARGNCQYAAESSYVDDSACTSELQYSEHRVDEQSHYDAGSVHYQYEGEPFYQSDSHPKTEDHARYVSEEYVHFHFSSRNSQQGVDAAGMMMMKMASCEAAAEELDNREDPPSSADTSGGSNQRRKLPAPPINLSLEHSEGSLVSEDPLDTEDDALDTGDDLDVSVDGIDTPDETDSLEFNGHADSEGSNLGEGAASGGATAGRPAEEKKEDERLWRSVVIGEQEHRIDMKCIEPYKRVISHGGYYAEKNAIIVFAACFLPDSDCDNYNYVMENLFLYVISTLELMVAEDYMIVYLNGATPRRRMPGFTWMKRCYQMIDRRLKKDLKMFFIVHPSWFVRTLLGITRPFISSKFSSKIKYVNSLKELGELIPMEYVHIPPSIIKTHMASPDFKEETILFVQKNTGWIRGIQLFEKTPVLFPHLAASPPQHA